MNPVSAANRPGAQPPMATERGNRSTPSDATELSMDELEAVCGGLARAWIGPPENKLSGPPSPIVGPAA
jgi:hypothetical protein